MMTMWFVWACGLNSLVDYFDVKTHDIREVYVTTRGGDFAWEHPSPKVLGHMGGSDTNEGDSMEVRVQYVKVYAILYIGH
jgi:hypothetical protein